MSVTLKFYFNQFADNASEEDIRLTRLYNKHLMESMDSLRQYFLREGIMISDYIEYTDSGLFRIIKSYLFILNGKYNFYGMYENMGNIAEYNIDEKYEFKVKFDTILNDITITKYAIYGTNRNVHYGAKYKYYTYYSIEDGTPDKFYNIKE